MTNLKFNRILIVRLSALGDVVNTIPVLTVLRRNYPKSFIAWVVEDKAKDLLLGHPDLDKVFVFRRKGWQIDLFNPTKLLRLPIELPDFIYQMQVSKFDIALDFQGNLKSGLITYLSGAKTRIGFEKSVTREFNHLFINHKIPLSQPRINRVTKNFLLLKSLGLNTEYYQGKIPVNPAAEQYFNEFTKQYLRSDRPLVIFHPGTSRFGIYKRWSSANYAVLGERLIKEYGVNLIITYGPGERPLAEEIISQMNPPLARLGETGALINYETNPLSRFTALLKKSDLFIGSDSGPLHLASLLGVPIITLFGPKDPVIYGPYHNKNAIIIQKDLNCSPCTKRKCHHPDCMTLITVDEVFEAAQKMLTKMKGKR